MENGRVKSFDDVSGSGWIIPADGVRDLFVHKRSILDDGIKTLSVNALVTYESRTNAKGIEAFNVSVTK